MNDFVRISHKIHCGCIYSEEGCILTPCAGHKDHQFLQRGKRAPVVPLRKEVSIMHVLAMLNPFRKGPVR